MAGAFGTEDQVCHTPSRGRNRGGPGTQKSEPLASPPDSSTLLLIGADMGIGLTFSRVRDNVASEGVVFRPLAPAPGDVEIRLAWRHSDANPALAAVVELSEEVFPAL